MTNRPEGFGGLATFPVAEHEAALARTPGIDRFCSSADWVVPAHRAFAPRAAPLILQADDNWGLLAEYAVADPDDGDPRHDAPSPPTTLAGLEPIWGFACPLAGPEPERITALLAQRAPEHRWRQIVLPGFPPTIDHARRAAAPLTTIGVTGAVPGITRQVAHLDDLDAWWNRRSSRFRRNLRRARRAAAERGLTYEDVSDAPDLVHRLTTIEAHSWKGHQDDGLRSPELAAFYRSMVARLQPRGECRALIARIGDEDLGYILGAVRDGRYRGFQLSFAQKARSLSLGHLLQWEQIERLAGQIDRYDLGMEMAYKGSWADEREQTIIVVCRPHPH